MLALSRLTLRGLVAVGLLAVAAADSQAQFQPQVNPFQPQVNPFPWNANPWNPNFSNPAFPWHKQPEQLKPTQAKNPIRVMPSINTMPGIPASNLFVPIMQPPSWLNPALNNPWMNQTTIVPVRARQPFVMNPMFNNPFALNPLLQQAAWFNELNMPGYIARQPYVTEWGPVYGPTVQQTPPIAIREPGQYFYKGYDLQVNPTTGTVYQPQSGVVSLADGSKFYRVPGTGLPTATGMYATGTGLYYNPEGNTFFNPRSGIISKPGQTNVFMPYVW